MTELLLIRHGRTAWNQAGRIQGHTDIALCAEGRAELAARSLPERFRGWRCCASPLARARETARLLGAGEPCLDPRLAEMRWGRWEGRTLAGLRRRHGEAFRVREALGLDFRPPGGESPREVRARLAGWLAERAADGPWVVVTHKGVIRVALSLATGWELRGAPPVRLRWECGHRFAYHAGQRRLVLLEPNIELACGS